MKISPKHLIIFLQFSIILISLFSVSSYFNSDFKTLITNTSIWWIINSAILAVYFLIRKTLFNPTNNIFFFPVKLYLSWNIFSIIRGFFIAETYWEWKGLINVSMALLVPIVAYSASNNLFLQSIFSSYIKYALPLFVVIALFIPPDSYGLFLVPISILILFTPVLNKRPVILILVFVILVLFADLGARSNIIKFSFPFILILIYFSRFIINIKILESLRKILFITPFLFFLLAINGIFNPFKIDEYLSGRYVQVKVSNGETVEESLTADTRTLLYEEVLNTALKYNSWLIGRSPARGNETEWFADEAIKNTGKAERLGNEVAILNIFTWTGIVGLFLYFFVFYKASFLALNKSNNIIVKLLGLFIAFRWVFAWVEDVNNFSLTYFFLWFTIGLCLSKSFRDMSDLEIKYWARGIFSKNYRNTYIKIHILKSSP